MMPLIAGCQTLPERMHFWPLRHKPTVADAKSDLDDGDFYEARRRTEEILAKDPQNKEAQVLMARIIDEEIARHKELFETTAPEEFSKDQKSEEIRTWIERGNALFEAGEYDEATLATEKVFQYDPGNQEASELLDEIRNRAIAEGQEQALIQGRVVRGEVETRVAEYHRQAEDWVRQKRWGAARLTVDKILLLSPEDGEALKLRERIRTLDKEKA